jgi:hypothetical protein
MDAGSTQSLLEASGFGGLPHRVLRTPATCPAQDDRAGQVASVAPLVKFHL